VTIGSSTVCFVNMQTILLRTGTRCPAICAGRHDGRSVSGCREQEAKPVSLVFIPPARRCGPER
jgi:hypothetical protein